MTRASLRLTVLAAAIFAAAGALVAYAWLGRSAARRARLDTIRLQAQGTAEGIVRGLDAEIDALVEEESRRPYYHYQHYFSPPDALAAQFVIQTSPLAGPTPLLVGGYFEVLPDGRLVLPTETPGGPLDPGHETVAREVLPDLIARVRRAPKPAPAQTAVALSAAAPEEPPPQSPPQVRRAQSIRPPPDPPRQDEAQSPPQADVQPPPQEPQSPPVADAGGPKPQSQVAPMPRWAVESNVRANDLVGQINVANSGDLYAQQALQNEYNFLLGNPAQPPMQAAPPPDAGEPDAGVPEPPDAGAVEEAAAEPDAGATSAFDAVEPSDARPDHTRPPRRRDAGASLPPTVAVADAAVETVETAGTAPPSPTAGTEAPAAEASPESVPVVYGAFERLDAASGATYFARTVDIEGDVRVQGFRVSPGGLRAELGNLVIDGQRGHDAFRLSEESSRDPTALAAAPVDGVPGIGAIVARLAPDSPTLAAEDAEDRRIIGALAGLAAAIAVAVALAFLALRREIELARRKSDFVSAVSHELRAPVTTIRMYGEMLRDGWVDEAGKRSEYEAAIVSEGERLSRLVENVLAYARRERGKPLDLRDADLAAKVREACDVQRPVFEKEALALEVDAPETLPWRFDPDAVVQILVNLLDNARKHSKDAADRRVTARVEATPDSATISVEDRGDGIPASEQRRIFEPFYRVGSELTRTTRGAGLGLALVQRLARAHGGDVSVRSDPGKGATFVVRLGRPRDL